MGENRVDIYLSLLLTFIHLIYINMLKKSYKGVIVPEIAASRFGTLKEGVHLVVIKDAVEMRQNQELTLSNDCKIVVGADKSIAIARPCFDQDITSIAFQLKDGTEVIVDRRSNFGWAKLNETFVSRATGEVVMLDAALIAKHGLKEFAYKYYVPNADPNKEVGIEDAAAEAKCFDMLARVYNAVGLAGQEMNPASLIGKELKIKVEVNPFSKPGDKFERYKVSGWYKADANVSTTVEKTVAVAEPAEAPLDLPF